MIIVLLFKGIILTSVFSNAIQRWGIFDPPRELLKRLSYFRRLFACYECCSVWGAALALTYLLLWDNFFITYALICHWFAAHIRVALDLLDAIRAKKEGEI